MAQPPDSYDIFLSLREQIFRGLGYLYQVPCSITQHLLGPRPDLYRNVLDVSESILASLKLWIYSPAIPSDLRNTVHGQGNEDPTWRLSLLESILRGVKMRGWTGIGRGDWTTSVGGPGVGQAILLGWMGVGVATIAIAVVYLYKTKSIRKPTTTLAPRRYPSFSPEMETEPKGILVQVVMERSRAPNSSRRRGPISRRSRKEQAEAPTPAQPAPITHSRSILGDIDEAQLQSTTPNSQPSTSNSNSDRPTSKGPSIPPHILLLQYIYPNSSFWPAHYLRAFRLADQSTNPEYGPHPDAPPSDSLRNGRSGRWNGKVVLSKDKVMEDLEEGVVGYRSGVEGLEGWEGVEWSK